MRLVTYKRRGWAGGRVGALRADGAVLDLSAADQAVSWDNMPALITGGEPMLKRARAAAAHAPVVAGAILLAPIPRPAKNIFCVGKNYREHAREFAGSGFDATTQEVVPEAPVVFSKPPTSVSGPGDAIPSFLDATKSVDYEGELAVVIGKAGRGIRRADWQQHVFGYTIVNDVTARNLQQRHRQWILGKGIDGFCPMGPAILTADEVPDPTAAAADHPRQRRAAAGCAGRRPDLRHPEPDRGDQRRHHPGARRHHRHRHPGRGRHRLPAAALPEARRRGADRGRRHRRAGKPGRLTGKAGLPRRRTGDRLADEPSPRPA